MLTYVLGLAAMSADPLASAAAVARIEVGGYVPATCRASAYDPATGAASLSSACTGGALVSVSEEELADDTKLVRIVVSPR